MFDIVGAVILGQKKEGYYTQYNTRVYGPEGVSIDHAYNLCQIPDFTKESSLSDSGLADLLKDVEDTCGTGMSCQKEGTGWY